MQSHFVSGRRFSFSILLFFLFSAQTIVGQKADLILTNGKIFTSDTSKLFVEALAIRGKKILATGSNASIEKLASSSTKRIDLKGKTVVPGFNDAHDHLGWTAPIGLTLNVRENTIPGPSIVAVLDSVSQAVRKAKPNQWIHGSVGLTVLSDTNMRRALDSIAPNNPVLLESWWGHGMAVNSKALRLAGIGVHDPDPLGGYYGRSKSTKELNGLIGEYAQLPIWNAWLTSEPQVLVKALKDYGQDQLSFGITTVQNINGVLQAPQVMQVFKQANLPLHTRILLWPYGNSSQLKGNYLKYQHTRPAPLTYVSGVKYLIDGTPIENNALMTKPYDGRPNWYGRLNFPVDTIRTILQKTIEDHTQLLLHIVGDSSFSVVLSLMKEIAPADEWKKRRVRIEHNSIRNTAVYLEQIKAFGLLMMHTPVYAKGSLLKTLLNSGVHVGIAPDGIINPFVNILMVTRQMEQESENITREEAIIAYTHNNAYAEFAEEKKGTLMEGKQADLVVLSADIFTIPEGELTGLKSILTIINGKIVYQNGKL